MKSQTRTNFLKAILLASIAALTTTAPKAQKAENAATSAAPTLSRENTAKIPLIQEWKAPGGSGPNIQEIFYDAIPLSEIVKDLREEFKRRDYKFEFDFVLPKNLVIPKLSKDVQAVPVSLYLKNVNASEIFNAMNLYFDIQKVPLRWELTMNGRRPTAVLHVLEDVKIEGGGGSDQQQRIEPIVIYVGDLIGDEKSGKMPIDKIARTLLETYVLAYGGAGEFSEKPIQCHKEADLIVVRGTASQVRFVSSAVEALKQKVETDRLRKLVQRQSEPKPVSPQAKDKTP